MIHCLGVNDGGLREVIHICGDSKTRRRVALGAVTRARKYRIASSGVDWVLLGVIVVAKPARLVAKSHYFR
jgi:hypothetical protein